MMKSLGFGDPRASTATCVSCLCRADAAAGLATFALLAVLGGCNSDRSDTAAPADANASPTIDGGLVTSLLERELDPQVPTDDMSTLASGNAAFAFDLYGKLKEGDGNLVFSPASISLALAMAYAGAKNSTAAEMATALHFALPPDRLHRAFNALDQALASRGQGLSGSDGGAMRLTIANSAWLENTFRPLPAFLDTLAVNYGAGLHLVDFIGAPDASRLQINAWVADQTAGQITDLLAPLMITSGTRLVLVNAVYFNAAWLYPFNAINNHANYFTLLDGTLTTKSYMYASMNIGAVQGANFVAAALPYQDARLSMMVVVPDPGRFAEVEAALDETSFGTMIEELANQKVSLYLPPFHLDARASLPSVLRSLGMQSAFCPAPADFSGIAADPLCISEVIHEAFVKVAEKGTEAGAATAVVLEDSGMAGDEGAGPPPLVIRAERPFLYFI
jgi:serpin B